MQAVQDGLRALVAPICSLHEPFDGLELVDALTAFAVEVVLSDVVPGVRKVKLIGGGQVLLEGFGLINGGSLAVGIVAAREAEAVAVTPAFGTDTVGGLIACLRKFAVLGILAPCLAANRDRPS